MTSVQNRRARYPRGSHRSLHRAVEHIWYIWYLCVHIRHMVVWDLKPLDFPSGWSLFLVISFYVGKQLSNEAIATSYEYEINPELHRERIS